MFKQRRLLRLTGDSEHKPYICGDADHDTFPLDGTEDYLILACDGFYDTVSPDEAVRVVSDHLEENAGDSTMVAHKLVASARDAGSSDNITVIVVFLRDPRCPPPGDEEAAAAAAAAREEGEEEAVAEVEEEDEEEALQGGERGCQEEGGATDAGGKGRGGWPVQQCSAPADLGYEDRMDSFTDRTSLSLLGPALGEGRVGLPPASSVQPPFSAGFPQDVGPAAGLGSAWLPDAEEGPQRPARRPKSRVPACQEPSSTDGLWPQAAALFGQTGRRTRRMECVSPRWGGRRAGRAPGELLHSGRSVPYPQRCPVRRPGVALPHLPSGSTV